jgi:uncharacterized protein YdeI (YjbR/CyaY-like superfamily)
MTDPRVDAYIARAQPFAQPILRHLRTLVHDACPGVEEGIKWSHVHFDYKGMFCGMAAFKAHCTFGFWKHTLLVDRGLLEGPVSGMGSFGKIESLDELPPDRKIISVIRSAAKLNDEGVKTTRPKHAPKPAVKVPSYFTAAVKKNKRAHAAFQEFSPSHRREYVEWITEAKSDETRQRRMATAIEWMAKGKSRNWKYEPKHTAAKVRRAGA